MPPPSLGNGNDLTPYRPQGQVRDGLVGTFVAQRGGTQDDGDDGNYEVEGEPQDDGAKKFLGLPIVYVDAHQQEDDGRHCGQDEQADGAAPTDQLEQRDANDGKGSGSLAVHQISEDAFEAQILGLHHREADVE